ncbi:glycoside hydrolase family 27 protein [Calocera cornea HHB12733]|uniref:Alpha-galactosidase n=1 Tax=Calocera cornea HHB12733 TaxID=1353952 RepID=A0A165D240_9BASI|nr:glycoside hydrolase family 27 protein [Calocera cornea HHB12733]
MALSWFAVLAITTPLGVVAYRNGLALTPQMGWNTWNYFGCNVSESTILSAAQAIVDNGLDKYGYEYVIVDDCWHDSTRDPDTGAPRPDPTRFPNGIKAVADEVHSLGLKFGIYSDAGEYTCGGRYGSLGYEEIDAKTYASWDVDYLKYDNCFNDGQSGIPLVSFNRYANMSRALNATGRPILYSMCNWGQDGPWDWAPTIANSWRISGDIFDTFDRADDRCPCTSAIGCLLSGWHCSVMNVINKMSSLGQKAGPGIGWNDADMLEVGNGGMTKSQYIVHFSFWAILKSPLILGNDVTQMTNETLEIITNDAIIAINQDASGSPASRIWVVNVTGGELQLWAGSLSTGATVIGLLNSSPTDQTIDLKMADVFIDSSAQVKTAKYRLYDLWQRSSSNDTVWGKDIGVVSGEVPGVSLAPQSCLIYLAVPEATASSRKRYDEF